MRMMPRSPSCSTWQEVHCVAFAWNCVDCFVPKSVPAWQVRQVRVSTPLPGVWQAVHWPAKDWCALESGPGETSCATRPASLGARSEEHTSELQSLMRSSYAVFCLKTKLN